MNMQCVPCFKTVPQPIIILNITWHFVEHLTSAAVRCCCPAAVLHDAFECHYTSLDPTWWATNVIFYFGWLNCFWSPNLPWSWGPENGADWFSCVTWPVFFCLIVGLFWSDWTGEGLLSHLLFTQSFSPHCKLGITGFYQKWRCSSRLFSRWWWGSDRVTESVFIDGIRDVWTWY